MVISKSENERLDKMVKENGGGLFRANYILIDSTNKVIEESKFEILGENGTIELKKKKGIKSSEQVILPNSSFTKDYFENGNLRFEDTQYNDEEFGYWEMREYFDNKWNTLKKVYIQKRIAPEKFKGIIIEDWRIEEKNRIKSLLVEQEVDYNIYVPIQEIQFHPNGKIKVKGNFSKRNFWEFRNKEFYQEWLKGRTSRIDNYSLTIGKRVKVKNGKWEYFDQEGKLDKVEYYENGKLLK